MDKEILDERQKERLVKAYEAIMVGKSPAVALDILIGIQESKGSIASFKRSIF